MQLGVATEIAQVARCSGMDATVEQCATNTIFQTFE